MDVNVVGRVNNLVLSKTKGLLPVQEAVINSIEAGVNSQDASINVIIDRDTTQSELDDQRLEYPVSGFRVVDTGVGFTEENYQSFRTSDSTLKAESGGKGIGRFLWLKAFDSVGVDSTFTEEGRWRQRKFDFLLTEAAVEGHDIRDADMARSRTEVSLRSVRERYRQYMPKRTAVIAQRILEHCLSFFILGQAPKITVIDALTNESISLNGLYEENVRHNIDSEQLSVRKSNFRIHIIRYPTTSESRHRVFYCAHSREVRSENLQDLIPLLSRRVEDGNGEFVFMVYVSGEYLDRMVNQERTGFAYDPADDEEQTDLGFEDVVPFHEIRKVVSAAIREAAEPYLEPIRREHRARVADFVRATSPEYRHVLKHRPEEVDQISPGASEDKLELSLHQISQRIEHELKESSVALLKTEVDKVTDVAEFKERYNQLIDRITDIGQSNLARYVTHRKTILNLLENRLNIQDDEHYSLEESIHEIVIPLKTTSDETDYLKQNLWIIDEKLSYHFFLASDQPLKSIPETDSDSKSRPDILIFNKPLAFAEDDPPYSSIVIVEFKRPVRNDYTDEDNPVMQVMKYVTEIRDKRVKDKNGRFIHLDANTPFYAYIICDITPKLQQILTLHDFFEAPDPGGYYLFNKKIKTYIEVISFDKLLSDAKKRNRVLFERLGLHT